MILARSANLNVLKNYLFQLLTFTVGKALPGCFQVLSGCLYDQWWVKSVQEFVIALFSIDNQVVSRFL